MALISVYKAQDGMKAQLAADALHHEDIPAEVVGDLLLGGTGELGIGGLVQVLVPEQYVEAALQTLARWEADLS